MTSLQYHCIMGLAEMKTLHPRDKIMRMTITRSIEVFCAQDLAINSQGQGYNVD